VPTSLPEARFWILLLTVLSVAEGLIILLALARLSARRPPRSPGAPVDSSIKQELAAIGSRLSALEKGMGRVVDALPRTIQGIGVVRYNPFPDTGSNMSFSLALLDGRASGVVVSVLTHRDGSRVYGKPVEEGTSEYPLSDEERKALSLAQNSRR
jgi:Protein of unknown function (DUF4446)